MAIISRKCLAHEWRSGINLHFFLYYFHAKKIRREEFDISVMAYYYYYYYYYYLEINTYKVHYKLQSKTKSELWVPVSSTGKISDGCIRDLGFNPRLHQKWIGVLIEIFSKKKIRVYKTLVKQNAKNSQIDFY